MSKFDTLPTIPEMNPNMTQFSQQNPTLPDYDCLN